MKPKRVDCYWAQFISGLPESAERPLAYVEAFFFGTDPARAHEISPLVVSGVKTATGSLVWAYEFDEKPLPRVGDYWLVTDGGDDPVCVIRTVDVAVIPFEEVGEEYALAGGEGDRTLESWREMYWNYVVGECQRIGRAATRQAPLAMERFEVVYAEPLRESGS